MQVEDVLAAIAALVELLLHRQGEAGLDLLERDAVLRALGPGERGLDLRQLELEHVGEDGVRGRLGAVHALRLGVGGDQRDLRCRPAGIREIFQRVVVDREEAAGRTVFRRHVADGGAVRDREVGEARAKIFHELAYHAAFAQHLRDGEHEVGRGHALLELAGQPHADDLGEQHRIGLAEHGRLRFDAADAPAQHGEAVDHGGVGIGADEGVRIGDIGDDGLAVELDLVLLRKHRLREVFEVDLMADAGAGRHHAEIVERLLRPFQEFVAFPVLPVFLLHVLLDRGVGGKKVDRHRVIADQIDRDERIDLLRIAAQRPHGIAHGGKVDHRRDAGEVLHQYPRRTEGDFAVRGLGLEPLRHRLEVLLGDGAPVLVAQEIFQQHLHRERQPRDPLETVLLGDRQAVIGVGLAADLQGFAAAKAVE